MKQILLSAIAFIAIATVQAQNNPLLDNLSLEAGYGYNMAITPSDDLTLSDLNRFSAIHAGATYHISSVWGVRGSYAYNQFQDKDDSSQGLSIHRLMLEATYDILEGINRSPMPKFRKFFDVTAHAGVGLSVGQSKWATLPSNDAMANAQVGLKPTYFITQNFRVFLDASYVFNLDQNYAFNGSRMTPNADPKAAGMTTFVLGVQIKLRK